MLGDDALARDRLVDVARGILEPAGYGRIETPTFESTSLFARGVGESTDVVQKEMYTFDSGESDTFTLRPEGTAPVCRAYLEHGMHKLPQPVKLWYLSSFFRRERPQKGRYRQFWQIGAEAIGSEDPAVDAELILLLAEILHAIGARGLRLRLSSLGTPDTRAAYRIELADYLRTHEDRLSQEVRDRIDLNPLRAFDADHPGTREVMEGAPRLLDRLNDEDRAHFDEVKALLDAAGISYEVDPSLVRGLDYYTRTVFEYTSDALGAQSGVGGGGRYDGLMEQIGGNARARDGLGRRGGADAARLAARAGRRRLPSTSTSPTPSPSCAPRRSGWPPTRGERGTPQDSNSPGARSRASSSRRTARAPATLRSSVTRGSRSRTWSRASRRSWRPRP